MRGPAWLGVVLALWPASVVAACGSGSGGPAGPASDSGAPEASVERDSGGADTSSGADADASVDGGSDAAAADSSPPVDAPSDAACRTDAPTPDAGMGCPYGLYGCGAPTQCGPVVQATATLQSPPAGAGGTIQPGLYYLTSVIIYGRQLQPLDTFQFTLQLTTTDFAESSYQGGYGDSPMSGTYTTSGTTLHRNRTCTGTYNYADPYTATATTLTIYRIIGGCDAATYADTFTLQ